MSDDFSFIGVDDETDEDNGEPQTLGLVVGAVATNSAELMLREEMFRTDGLAASLVIFEEDDDDGESVFVNADVFMRAMGMDWLPTIEEATAWKQREMSAALDRWRDRLAEAQALGPDLPAGKPRR
jgi:hypothetical protein